ncbi:hypothetical protein [Methanolacinia petrolearia]|uniref:hypothetical protein n=1 Tax=Methanolacinia petrolearia TaxID=54120 RepID=UPI003BA980D8
MRILYEVFFLFRLSDFFFLLCKLPEHLLLLVNPLYLGTNIRKLIAITTITSVRPTLSMTPCVVKKSASSRTTNEIK